MWTINEKLLNHVLRGPTGWTIDEFVIGYILFLVVNFRFDQNEIYWFKRKEKKNGFWNGEDADGDEEAEREWNHDAVVCYLRHISNECVMMCTPGRDQDDIYFRLTRSRHRHPRLCVRAFTIRFMMKCISLMVNEIGCKSVPSTLNGFARCIASVGSRHCQPPKTIRFICKEKGHSNQGLCGARTVTAITETVIDQWQTENGSYFANMNRRENYKCTSHTKGRITTNWMQILNAELMWTRYESKWMHLWRTVWPHVARPLELASTRRTRCWFNF